MLLPRKLDQQQIIDAAQAEIDSKFPVEKTIEKLMRAQYFRLSLVTEGFTELRGKRVLDIGCGAVAVPGSVEEKRRANPKNSEPWFARFATACGADVTGLDRRKSENETYKHISVDLTDPHAFDQFPDDSFDIVNSSAFLVAPKKQVTDSVGLNVTAPELLDRYKDDALDAIDEQITAQAIRVLKEGGYFLYNEQIYQKEKGGLKKMPLAILLAEKGFPSSPQRNA